MAKGQLPHHLVSVSDRMAHARVLLTNPALTAFFFVALAEALSIVVVGRFIQWFKDFGISVGGALVNIMIDPALVGPDVAEFVKNRVAMQQEHMQTIWREFDDSVRAIVPLFETEVRGVADAAAGRRLRGRRRRACARCRRRQAAGSRSASVIAAA
jgi:arsenite/tail-anchored protein-transporting ATPase